MVMSESVPSPDMEPVEQLAPVADEPTEAQVELEQEASNFLPEVVPGQNDGWAHFVMRCLGLPADVAYEAEAVELVKDLQSDEGFEADGVVAGATWALVLPVGKVHQFIDPLAVAVYEMLGGDATAIDTEGWGALIDARMDELGI